MTKEQKKINLLEKRLASIDNDIFKQNAIQLLKIFDKEVNEYVSPSNGSYLAYVNELKQLYKHKLKELRNLQKVQSKQKDLLDEIAEYKAMKK